MNIKHAETEIINGDKLKAIFDRQKELMEKYHHIEQRSGLLQTEDCPVNLDDMRGQARLKDFAWRITEEVGEALDGKDDFEHFTEELIDGLHFLTEFTILAGLDYKDIPTFPLTEDVDVLETLYENRLKLSVEELVTMFVRYLGMTCNCLKNKPWKQSQMSTDSEMFYSKLRIVWEVYISILGIYLEPQAIAEVYLKKSQVNKFRQRSNY